MTIPVYLYINGTPLNKMAPCNKICKVWIVVQMLTFSQRIISDDFQNEQNDYLQQNVENFR